MGYSDDGGVSLCLAKGRERKSFCMETAEAWLSWGKYIQNLHSSFSAIPVPMVPSAPHEQASDCNTWQISPRRTQVESDFSLALEDHTEAVPLPLAQLDPGRLVPVCLSLPRNLEY